MNDLPTIYRPTSIDEVIGQDHIINSLRTKPSKHAFLLHGPSGCGKTTLGKIIAKMYDCNEVLPVNGSDATGVDYWRQEVPKLRHKSLHGGNKAIIVDECHKLSSNAWDMLLDPVENSPIHLYWIFCTTEFKNVRPAMRQRCLSYEVMSVPEHDLANLVFEVADREHEINGSTIPSVDVIKLIATAAEGSPRKALVGLETVRDLTCLKQIQRLLDTCGESMEVIGLVRALGSCRPCPTWRSLMILLNRIENPNSESIRCIMSRYYSTAARNSDFPGNAIKVLRWFSEPYLDPKSLAPLLVSIHGFLVDN